MAQRLIYDASDGIFGENSSISTGNWPKTVVNGGNSGATEVKRDNGNTQPPHDLNGGNDHVDNDNTATNRRDTDSKRVTSGECGFDHAPERQQRPLSQQGKYGQVRLYWWQRVGVEWAVDGAKSGLDARLIGDEMRCVAEDTKININRGGKGWTTTIADVYYKTKSGWWDRTIPTKTRSLVNGEIRLQRIRDVHFTGEKECIRIETESGKKLTLTEDHKVATAEGWLVAGDLEIGDQVLTNGIEIKECKRCGSTKDLVTYKYAQFPGYCKQCVYRYKRNNDSNGLGGRSIDADGYVRISGQYDHPRAQNSGYQVKEHELVMEKHLGRYLLWPDEHVHHKDHNKLNNDIDNLELLTPNEHAREHGEYQRFGPMTVPHLDRVVATEYVGTRKVYDITMAGDHPNFVANGVIVHNCGKTPTAIALDIELRKLIQRRARGNNCTLIVCPKSVITHWAELLRSMGVPSGEICEVDLPRKQALRKVLGHISADKRKSTACPWYVILNWDTVQTIRGELQRAGPWFHIIGDEIHRIKSRNTKRTEAYKKVKGKHKTGLSGTPADNKPEDFWSVLNWLYPQEFSSYWAFVETYCNVTVNRKTGYKYIDGVNWGRLDELRERLAPFYIRRSLVEVAGDVPVKQRRTVTVDMGARQRREYAEMEQEGIAEVEGGDVLTPLEIVKRVRLQQMAIGCCAVNEQGEVSITDQPRSPKLDWIEEYIRDEPESGPFIIFAQHQDTVALMGARLRKAGIQTSTLVGTDPTADRSTAVRRFRSGESTCFIGTIRACREGITLSEANTIIFVDRDWSANANRQAEARADSVTGNKPVTIITLEARDSIDQDRRLKIDAKAEATDAITSTSN